MTTPSRRRSSSASAVIRSSLRAAVDAEDLAHLERVVLPERSHGERTERARVEHEQVEPAELRDQFGQRRAVVGIGDVAGDSMHGRTGDGFAETGGVTCVGDHGPAGVVEGAHEREAESGGATGDEGYGWCGFCCHAPSVKVQVNLRSRGDMDSRDVLSMGEVAKRSGFASSALRFYEAEGLIVATRTSGGQRRFRRDVLRRLAFIRAASNIGLTLEEVREELDRLPEGRVPNRADWQRITRHWRGRLNNQIEALERLRDGLDSCIGCGCLSLQRCQMTNPARLDGDERRRSGRREPAGTAAPSAPVPVGTASGPGWPRPPRRPSLPPGRGSGHPSRPAASPRRARRRAASRWGCSGRRCPRH